MFSCFVFVLPRSRCFVSFSLVFDENIFFFFFFKENSIRNTSHILVETKLYDEVIFKFLLKIDLSHRRRWTTQFKFIFCGTVFFAAHFFFVSLRFIFCSKFSKFFHIRFSIEIILLRKIIFEMPLKIIIPVLCIHYKHINWTEQNKTKHNKKFINMNNTFVCQSTNLFSLAFRIGSSAALKYYN